MITGPIDRDVLVEWLHLPTPAGARTLDRATEWRASGYVDDDSDALRLAVAEHRALTDPIDREALRREGRL